MSVFKLILRLFKKFQFKAKEKLLRRFLRVKNSGLIKSFVVKNKFECDGTSFVPCGTFILFD